MEDGCVCAWTLGEHTPDMKPEEPDRNRWQQGLS